MCKTSLRILGLLLACAVAVPGPEAGEQAGLTVRLDADVEYECDGGVAVQARYFSLSDDSLRFVRLTLPGGDQFTLPAVLSASGARYADERSLTWWVKGNSAFAEQRGPDGQWSSLYESCRATSDSN